MTIFSHNGNGGHDTDNLTSSSPGLGKAAPRGRISLVSISIYVHQSTCLDSIKASVFLDALASLGSLLETD